MSSKRSIPLLIAVILNSLLSADVVISSPRNVCATLSTVDNNNGSSLPNFEIGSNVPISRSEWKSLYVNSSVHSISVIRGCSLRVCHLRADRSTKAQVCNDFEQHTDLGNETEVKSLYRWDRSAADVLGMDCSCEMKCQKSCEMHSITEEYQCATLFQDENCTDCRFNGIPLFIGQTYDHQDNFSVISSMYVKQNCTVGANGINIRGVTINYNFNSEDKYLHHINKEMYGFWKFGCNCEGVFITPKIEYSQSSSNPVQISILSLVSIIACATVLIASLLIYKFRTDKGKAQLYAVVNRLDEKYHYQPEDLVVDENDVLGEGRFGIVLKATFTTPDGLSKSVAAKRPKESSTESNTYLRCLAREIDVLSRIEYHPNIIKMIGVVMNTQSTRRGCDVTLLLELCKYKSLEKFLRDNKLIFLNSLFQESNNNESTDEHHEVISGYSRCSMASESTYFSSNTSEITVSTYLVDSDCLTFEKLVFWSAQIASAMEYLSDLKILHLDLQARNILLDENLNAVLSDFGLSKELGDSYRYVKPPVKDPLPFYIMSPEVMDNYSFSEKSEVWAFGVLLFELFSLGDTPYNETYYTDTTELQKQLQGGYRLPKPVMCIGESKIYQKMKSCWTQDPSERPSFSQLRKFLENSPTS